MAISSPTSFLVVDGLDTLASRKHSSFYRQLGLLDGTGTYWPVVALSPPRPTWLDRVLRRRLTMDLAVGAPMANGTKHAIQQLCEVFAHAPDDLFGHVGTRESLKRCIRSVKDAKELIEVVGAIRLVRDIYREVG